MTLSTNAPIWADMGKSFYWIESIIKVELCCEMAGAKEYCEEYRIALAT